MKKIDGPYNAYNLSSLYSHHLRGNKRSNLTVKNYLSDLRHFSGWLQMHYKTVLDVVSVKKIDSTVTTDYKEYLTTTRTSPATAKRRLSSLRTFFEFVVGQELITRNPLLTDTVTPTAPQKPATTMTAENLLSDYRKALTNDEVSDESDGFELEDVEEFLELSGNHNTN